ncbi:flagellar operon protein [Hydrogenispora ethanolica]|jgi:flagellar operon protein|uniref:Flagellar operon protein n=1 Tax=Hydrogenispora ethanolica TaxID=1082276 RepID=A0A4V2QE27_HYDET|nr:TIGR02530 family flagellar biosynthesis protein [Hydrogenispora ethanolica]TCL66547.1 flagellar operon protein [Hydrogenispora ethanolica]
MSEKIFIRPPQIGPVGLPATSPKNSQISTAGPDFAAVFQEQLGIQSELKFSAHALKRLESRQIELSASDLSRIQDAVNKAESKGAKESLIVMDQAALVVSIKNRTVITAVDDSNLKDNIFTNIDSAIVLKS